jgi:hypothetical protein
MGAHPSVSELLDNAASLDKQEFESFFKKMVLLRAQRHPAVLPKEESDLLQKINLGFPQDKWDRIEFLNGKLEYETLSEVEHAELMSLIDKYEAYMVRRVRYLGQLAILRKVSLNELIEQLGIAPKYHG